MNSDITIARSRDQSHSLAGFLPNPTAIIVILIVAVSLWTGNVFTQKMPLGVIEEIDGELEIVHQDNDQGGQYHYFLKTKDKRLALQFAAQPPAYLKSGAQLLVKGVRIEGTLALDSGTTSVQVLSSPTLQNTLGAQNVAVILVNFQNSPIEPYTRDFARQLIFGTVADFYLENSYQQSWFVGDVFGWYTIAVNSSNCDGFLIRDHAQQAATAAGIDLTQYKYVVFAFPFNSGCGYNGMAQIGGPNAWLNGDLSLRIVGHEFGHLLGLYHSKSLECGTTVIGDSCQTWENGDTLDIMGNVVAGHLSSFQKEQLGWLGGNILTVEDSGAYTIEGYEPAAAGLPKVLKVLKSGDPSSGVRTWYYMEFRRALGFDAFLASNSNVLNGIVVHLGEDGNLNSGRLLDMTPGSSWLETEDWNDPALTPGWSFTDPDAGVSISPISVSGDNLVVNVTLSNPSCVTAAPSIGLSPSEGQAVAPGTAVPYTVTITNNDAAQCPPASFNIQSALPGGWTATITDPNPTVAPGQIATATLTVTSSLSAGVGTYSITVSATKTGNGSQSASASVSYVVGPSLDVIVTTSQSIYDRNQTVTIAAKVSNGSKPAAKVQVLFTIVKADGSAVSATSTTGKSGEATYKLRLRRQDPVGTYQVTVDADLNGTMFGQGATTFIVQ